MVLTLAALLLLASDLPAASAPTAPKPVSVVVLRDGTRYTVTKPYEVRGSQARLYLTNGSLVAVRASEIDDEASKKATAAANAPPTPTPSPTPKPAAKSISIEGDPNEARPVTGGSDPSPVQTPGKTVYTGPRGGRYTITEGGNKNYVPRTPAPKR